MDLQDNLDHLDTFNNATQLSLLLQEIKRILRHGSPPPSEWYEARVQKLQAYDTLGWREFANEFHHKNPHLHALGHTIQNRLDQLMEEWNHHHTFHLFVYAAVIEEIRDLWTYYSTTYIGNERDEDVIDLIQAMTHSQI